MIRTSIYPEPADTSAHDVASSQWPQRSRQLVNELHVLACHWLHEPLQRTFCTFIDHLDECQGTSLGQSDELQRGQTRKTIHQTRHEVERRFLFCLGEAFRRMGDTPTCAPGPDGASSSPSPPGGLELAAVLKRMAACSIACNGEARFKLSYRLAVLVASPPLEEARQPLGPQALTTAFFAAVLPLQLPHQHLVQLLASFETTVLHDVSDLYKQADHQLLAQGILPQLHAHTMPGDTSRSPHSAHVGAPAGKRLGDTSTLDNPHQPLHHGSPDTTNGYDGLAQDVDANELNEALNTLHRHVVSSHQQASHLARSIRKLRKELLAKVNAQRDARSLPIQFSREHEQVIQLIDMLFEQLTTQLQHENNTNKLLNRIKFPIRRTATIPQDSPVGPEHPAQRQLQPVAKADSHWLGAKVNEPNHKLRAKLEALIDRASLEQPGAGLYTVLLADIEQHLNMLDVRARITERRNVESLKTSERITLARQRADAFLSDRLAAAKLPAQGLLRTLIEYVWTDVLVLALLRDKPQDSDSPAVWLITDQLLGLAPVANRGQLQNDVQKNLRQLGMEEEESLQTAQSMVLPEPAPLPTDDIDTHSTIEPQTDRTSQETAPQEAPLQTLTETPAHRAPAADEARVQAILSRLKKLPFGTWFEFTDPASGHISQHRLAWYSMVSGQALFVARNGGQTRGLELDALARQIMRGCAHEIPIARDNLIDRAWRNVISNLHRANGTAVAQRASKP